MHLRLCHRCLYLNEGSKHIEKCYKCESQFTVTPAVENNLDPAADSSPEEDPIQEALTDFDSERVKGEEETQPKVQEDKQDDSEEEGQTQQGYPISGLSVLW